MNTRLLKAKRVEKGLLQRDVAKQLGISEKAMCQKECSTVNKFKADEMLALVSILDLTLEEFDSIFFDKKLAVCNRGYKKLNQEGVHNEIE